MKPAKWQGAMLAPFNQWVDSFFNDDDPEFRIWRNQWNKMPAVNVKETPKAYLIEVAAPGFDKHDFKVNVEDGVMTIRAEKKTETEDKDKEYLRKEFSYSRFERQFALPDGVIEKNVKAEYVNGVLFVNIPRKEVDVKNPGISIPVA
jgi:HSP20 family protein